MSERDYQDHFSRRIADNVVATIESRNDDDTYMVRTIDRRALLRASKAIATDDYVEGSRVIIAQPSASRTVVGAMPTILSRAPREQRGLSATTPAETRDAKSVASIISVDPEPLVIRAGEDGDQVFIGQGLTGSAVYVEAHGGDDPDVTETNNSISATKVDVNAAAAPGCIPGIYDAILAGIRARGVLVVRPALPVEGFLWASGISTGPVLYKIDPTTLEVVATFSLASGGTGFFGGGIAGHGTDVYWIHGASQAGVEPSLSKIEPDETITTTALSIRGAGSSLINAFNELIADSEAAYGDAEGRLLLAAGDNGVGLRGRVIAIKFDASADTDVCGPYTTGTSGAASNVQAVVAIAGSIMHAGAAVATPPLRVLKPDGGGTTAATGSFRADRFLAYRPWNGSGYDAPNGVLVAAWFTDILRGLSADMSMADTYSPAVGSGQFRGIVQCQDLCYAIRIGTGDLYSFDPAGAGTLTHLATITAGAGYLATDNTSLFMVGTDKVPRKIDPSDGSVLATGTALATTVTQLLYF